jgi:hypothetical protein
MIVAVRQLILESDHDFRSLAMIVGVTTNVGVGH